VERQAAKPMTGICLLSAGGVFCGWSAGAPRAQIEAGKSTAAVYDEGNEHFG
jgi:hypothetical protein